MKILVIDNYDSFVYNLVHYLEEITDAEVTVVKNDAFELSFVEQFDKILLSPGPGIPDEAGKLKEVIREFGPSKSMLGVCLGHQAIAEVFECKLKNMAVPLHGIQSEIEIKEKDTLFANLPPSFNIGHYHSWVVDPVISEQITITAEDQNGEIMAIEHKEFEIFGVQFHPESVLTEYGKEILSNWLGLKCKVQSAKL
ncbi:MAG: aminodeoxychorismate/anthranilate synthase component II [Crocinitomicaceae bacterium]|nr:aminodeoxychorismate/anthranilate synthase component II [Crocinitomicaceae bacterium]